MSDKAPTPSAPDQNANAKAKATPKATYISGGQMLESPPLAARLSRFVDNSYNFLGLYFVSLFSFDAYTAAQNSQFNTRGPGRISNQARARWGAGVGGSGGAGAGAGGSGPRGGGSGGSGGRRLGTVDDVRGPECSSCG